MATNQNKERVNKGILEIGASRIPWKRDESDPPKPGAPVLFPLSMVSVWLTESHVAGKKVHTIEQLVKYLSSSQSLVLAGLQPWITPDGFLKLVYLFGTPKQQILATKKLLPFFEGAPLGPL